MSPSIYQLKPKFQQLLHPVLSGLARCHITPNQVTVFATVLSVLYGVMLATFPGNWRLWAGLPGFMFLRMALNAIDGMLATFINQRTRVGAVLNEVGDQLSDAALVLPFALVVDVHAPLIVAVAFTALLVEFAGLLAVLVGSTRRFDGPMGKSDRAFAFSLLAILIAFNTPAMWLNSLIALILLLLIWTLVNRLHRAVQDHDVPPTP